jgi:hypothetical protein
MSTCSISAPELNPTAVAVRRSGASGKYKGIDKRSPSGHPQKVADAVSRGPVLPAGRTDHSFKIIGPSESIAQM